MIHIVNHLQLSMNHITKYICRKQHVMNEIVNNLTLEVIGRQATAFLIGVNYYLRCHIDVDMSYTLTTVIAPKDICLDDIFYYFIFPTFGIRVLLRYSDLFLSNSIVPHSCSSPRYPGCHIMLAYVSQKTVLRSQPV